MKAIWVEAPGGLEVLRERELPVPEPKAHQVRVRVVCAGFNPVDAKWRAGKHGPPLPGVLGRDFSGVVEAVDEEVEEFEVGDAVLGYAGLASNGTYAEQLCVDEGLVAQKPRSIPFEVAAAIPVAYLTSRFVYDAARSISLSEDRIVIAGAAGGVGSYVANGYSLAALALTSSAAGEEHLVRACDVPRDRIMRLDQIPRAEWARAIQERFGTPSLYIDLCGGDLKRFGFEVLGAGGRMVSIVEEPADFAVPCWDDASPLVRRSLGFHFVQLGAALERPERAELYGRALEDHLENVLNPDDQQFRPDPRVLGPLSVETVREAHRLLESGGAKGKLVMQVSEP